MQNKLNKGLRSRLCYVEIMEIRRLNLGLHSPTKIIAPRFQTMRSEIKMATDRKQSTLKLLYNISNYAICL